MNESNCLACCNSNCDLYQAIVEGRDDLLDYPYDCPDMVWPGEVSE